MLNSILIICKDKLKTQIKENTTVISQKDSNVLYELMGKKKLKSIDVNDNKITNFESISNELNPYFIEFHLRT